MINVWQGCVWYQECRGSSRVVAACLYCIVIARIVIAMVHCRNAEGRSGSVGAG